MTKKRNEATMCDFGSGKKNKPNNIGIAYYLDNAREPPVLSRYYLIVSAAALTFTI